jgi:type II secretory pathway component PulJ
MASTFQEENSTLSKIIVNTNLTFASTYPPTTQTTTTQISEKEAYQLMREFTIKTTETSLEKDIVRAETRKKPSESTEAIENEIVLSESEVREILIQLDLGRTVGPNLSKVKIIDKNGVSSL